MFDFLAEYLEIQPSEEKVMFWTMALAFTIGIVDGYLNIVSMALFLTHFGSANLPKIFLVVSAIVMLLGIVYTWLEYRFALSKLVFSLFISMACVTILTALILSEFNSSPAIVLFVIWSSIVRCLLGLGLWSLVNNIYNLEQGKRLYGSIVVSQGLGGILAGLSISVVVLFISTVHVGLLAGILLFIFTFIMPQLVNSSRTLREGVQVVEQSTDINAKYMHNIIHNKYILKLFSLTLLGIFILVTVEMIFNTVAVERYPDPRALAGFYGVFLSVIDGAYLLAAFFIFPITSKRFGLIFNLNLYPLFILAFGFLLVTSYLIQPLIGLIFVVAILIKLFDNVIGAIFFQKSYLLLLQPLFPSLRAFVLSKNNLIVTSISSIIINVFFMIYVHYFGIEIPIFVLLLLIFSSLMILTAWTLKSDYIEMLTKAIARRMINQTDFNELNRDTLELFKKYLHSPYPDMVIYVLTSIERIDQAEFIKTLNEVINNKEYIIRQFVLQKIQEYQLIGYYPNVLEMLDKESDSSLKAQAIGVLSELDFTQVFPKINELVDDKSPEVYRAAIIASYRYGDERTKQKVLAQIQDMIHSQDKVILQSCAFIIGEISESKLNHLLVELLSNSDEDVKREVYLSAIKTDQIECFKELLQHFDMLELSGKTLKRFIWLAQFIMPIIKENFLTYSQTVQLRLLHLMPQMQVPEAIEFLDEMIFSTKKTLQLAALHSRSQVNRPVTIQLGNKLSDKIDEELYYLEEQSVFLEKTAIAPITQLLRDVLDRNIELSLERLLLFIAIYYHDKPIKRVKLGLLSNNKEDISYALELLHSTVINEHKKRLIPIMTSIHLPHERLAKKMDLNSGIFRSVLKWHLNLKSEEPLEILACLSCLYILKSIGTESFEPELEALKNLKLQIIQQTLVWLWPSGSITSF